MTRGTAGAHVEVRTTAHQVRRNAYLDAVRGTSAQLVLIGHLMFMAFPGALTVPADGGRLSVRSDQYHVQSHAVVVFLVLSGYVITRSVMRQVQRDTFTTRGYLLDRAARILTPLLPAIVVVVVLDRLILGPSRFTPFVTGRDDAVTVVSNVLLIQDSRVVTWFDQIASTDLARRSVGTAAPWWTVAYEWWIYVAFGLLVALVIAWRRRATLRSTSALATVVLAAPLLAFALATVLARLVDGNQLLIAWLVGFAYAAGARWLPASRALHGVVAVVAVAVCVVGLVRDPVHVFDLTTVLSTGIAVMSSARAIGEHAVRVPRQLAFTADFSYSLYLVHYSVLLWLAHLLPSHRGLTFVVIGLVGANVAALTWWALTERHHPAVRAWLRRRTGV